MSGTTTEWVDFKSEVPETLRCFAGKGFTLDPSKGFREQN